MKCTSKIKRVSKSGDVILEVPTDKLLASGFTPGDSVNVVIGSTRIKDTPLFSGPYCKTMGTTLITTNGKTSLSVRHGDAAKQYKVIVGDQVTIELSEVGRFWEKENAYSFKEIRDKTYYWDQETFANFRPLFNNGTQFFRASSPVDNAYGRAKATLYCAKKYRIKTIINTADSEEDFNTMIDSLSPTRKKAISRYNVFPIGNDAGLFSEEFQNTVVLSMTIIS